MVVVAVAAVVGGVWREAELALRFLSCCSVYKICQLPT